MPLLSIFKSRSLPEHNRVSRALEGIKVRRRRRTQPAPPNRDRKKTHCDLPALATVLEVAGQVGSSVPFLQGTLDATAKILTRVDAVKRNREECAELADLAQTIASALESGLVGVDESKLEDRTRLNLAELEWRLEQVAETMTCLQKKPLFKIFWRKDKYDRALLEHRESLHNAVTVFQIKEGIAMRCAMVQYHHDVCSEVARNHKEVLGAVNVMLCSVVLFDF